MKIAVQKRSHASVRCRPARLLQIHKCLSARALQFLHNMSLYHLPTDLHIALLAYISVQDLARLAQTCRLFQRLVHSPAQPMYEFNV